MGSYSNPEKTKSTQPHILCLPFPAQGHVNPVMQLAKLLHSKGFFITFVNNHFNHSRFVKSKGPEFVAGSPRFRFEAIDDGMPPSNPDATQSVTGLFINTKKYGPGALKDLILRINATDEVPPVSCIISDGIMCFAIKVAKELGIPEMQFWTASACGFLGYAQFAELFKRGIVPFKDENQLKDGHMESPLEWIQGMGEMRIKDLPSFIRTTDKDDVAFNFFLEELQDNLGGAGSILFNTFHEFEHVALRTISDTHNSAAKRSRCRHYSVGPLSLLCRNLLPPETSSRGSLWAENIECLQWLDKQAPNSVVYVNFGSITVMSEKTQTEFAWGLANSGHPFLWIIRSDVVMGGTGTLPPNFLEQTKDRAMMVPWCPQEKVLTHVAVAAFITHSGWNSTLEAVCGGKPMLSWPFFAEQPVNCRHVCTTWGMGVEIESEVTRQHVATLLREVVGESVAGKRMREKAAQWRRLAEEAAAEGGSSYVDFERFVEDLLDMISSNGK